MDAGLPADQGTPTQVIPVAAKRLSAIHNPQPWLWIPGSPLRGAPE
jgi:hypothetical protein